MSIERLVAGMTGKDSKLTIEEFFATDPAIPVVKHFGSLYLSCREKPLCVYARWSIHCRRAYIICLQQAYLSQYFTGGGIDTGANEDTIATLRKAYNV